MRAVLVLPLALLPLSLAGCATNPQMVMLNPRTGATVDCQQPDPSAATGDYLVSRACMSACEAHGFHPVPGMQAPGGGSSIPEPCTQ